MLILQNILFFNFLYFIGRGFFILLNTFVLKKDYKSFFGLKKVATHHRPSSERGRSGPADMALFARVNAVHLRRHHRGKRRARSDCQRGRRAFFYRELSRGEQPRQHERQARGAMADGRG